MLLSTVGTIPNGPGEMARYPTRIDCRFEGKDARIALDQIRTVDRKRLYKRLGGD